MKKNNKMILTFLLSAFLVSGVASFSQQVNEKIISSTKSTNTKNVSAEIKEITESFMNDYITNRENWLATSQVTENFKKAYSEKTRAISLLEKLLNNEIKEKDLSKEDKKLLEKYQGSEYDSVLGAAAFDTSPEHSKFVVKSWNEKTGEVILKDEIDPKYAVHSDGKPINVEIKLKLVNSNGKWLIDGAGEINMK